MYDRVIMASDENPKVKDVLLDLEEYENVDYYVGIMTSQEWCDHIKRGTNQLFTVYFDKHLVNNNLFINIINISLPLFFFYLYK